MKLILFLFGILTLFSCSNNSNDKKKVSKKTPITSIKNIPIEKERREDTLLYNKTFLIIGNKEMKIDYLTSNQKSVKIKSKGDTLFHDSKVTILGDDDYLTRVYKKYYTKFNFKQFSIDSIYQGKLALPNLSSINDVYCNYMNLKEWKEFIKTECIKQGINFAGHFTIVDWGCGAMCQNMCIVDRITGKVFFPDIPDDHIDGYYGVKFRKDSRMIMTNSAILEDNLGYYAVNMSIIPEIYEWRDAISKRLE